MSKTYLVPSEVTPEQKAEFQAWADKQPLRIKRAARRYPAYVCYRSVSNPRWHFVIQGYDLHPVTGVVYGRLVHGSDSTLPGVIAAEQPLTQLMRCDCGQWVSPRPDQIEATRRRIAGMPRGGLV